MNEEEILNQGINPTRGGTMTKLIKSRAALLLLALLFVALCASANMTSAAAAQTASTQSKGSTRHVEQSIRTDDHNWTWSHVDDDKRIEVRIRGHIEFADDYSDIKSIADDGSIRVTDERGGVTLKFEASATGGNVQRSYWVNGQQRPFDGEARAWLAKLLDDTVRQGGYDAKPRVRRILKQSGPSGVLQEITRLKGDYLKRIYFDELIKNGNLDDETVRQMLRQASTEIRSDYEKAQLLIQVSESYLRNDSQRAIYLEGVNTIHSDYEKGRTLGALLKKGELSRENMLFTLRAVGNITSDYERAELLIKIANGFTLDNSAGVAYVGAVGTLRSDYEKGRVLSAFLKKGEPQKETLLFAINSASSISSDYEKAQLLIKVAAVNSRDESVRSALIDTARTIHSEYERGRVLSAVFK
jgi:hypothetical protein